LGYRQVLPARGYRVWKPDDGFRGSGTVEAARTKWLMWALAVVAIALRVAVLAGKGDIRRFQRMRRCNSVFADPACG